MRVGVVVVVARVVGVVAALGPRARHESLEHLGQVGTPPGSYSIVVIAAVEPVTKTVTTPCVDRCRRAARRAGPRGGRRSGPRPGRAAAAARCGPPQAASRGAGSGACRPGARARRARSAGTSSVGATGSPSSFTPPWASVRRASERDPPNASAISSGRCTVPRAAASTYSSMSSGSSRSTRRGRSALGRRGAPPSPWKRATSARASARLASRARRRPPAAARRAAGRTTRPSPRPGCDSVLPYISSGGSVTPIWLPRTSTSSARRRCPPAAAWSGRPAAAGRRRAGSPGP